MSDNYFAPLRIEQLHSPAAPVRAAVETAQTHDLQSDVFEGGIEVVGGQIYRPSTQDITVAGEGRTTIDVFSDTSPQVSAQFDMDGETLAETVVTVFAGGEKLGSFRGGSVAFVPEGVLEFQTQPIGSSQKLVVPEHLRRPT